MKKQGTLIIACLTAAAAGVVIGMLIAPDKGENLRKNVKKTVGDWAGKLSDLVDGAAKKSDAEHDEAPVSGS